jgi:ferredoxin-NADP reductase
MLLKSVESEGFDRYIFIYSARNISAYPHHKSLKALALEYPFAQPTPWVCTRCCSDLKAF